MVSGDENRRPSSDEGKRVGVQQTNPHQQVNEHKEAQSNGEDLAPKHGGDQNRHQPEEPSALPEESAAAQEVGELSHLPEEYPGGKPGISQLSVLPAGEQSARQHEDAHRQQDEDVDERSRSPESGFNKGIEKAGGKIEHKDEEGCAKAVGDLAGGF